jgi:hypothetical protein
MEEGLTIAGGGGAGNREGPRWLERLGQVHGGAGDGRAECNRTQCLLQGTGPLPRTGGALEASCHRCQRETSAHSQRAEGAGEAACPGPAGDQTAQKGVDPEGQSTGRSCSLAPGGKKDRPSGERARRVAPIGALIESTSPADRQRALEILDRAVAAGATAERVADRMGIGLRTLQR